MSITEHRYDLAVVISVTDGDRPIEKLLDDVFMQDFPMDRVELVVADGSSGPETAKLVESYTGKFGSLKIIDSPGKNRPSGNNVGIKNSVAPYIVLLDSRIMFLDKAVLSGIFRIFTEKNVGCVCPSWVESPPGLEEFDLAVSVCRATPLGRKPDIRQLGDYEGEITPDATTMAWSRELFDKVGEFDDKLSTGDTIDMAIRARQAGFGGYAHPALRPARYPAGSLAELSVEALNNGRARFQLGNRHGEHSPLHLVSAILLAGVIVMALISLVSSSAFSFLITLVGLYVLGVVLYSVVIMFGRSNIGVLLFGPLVFPTIHFSSAFGYLTAMIERYLKK